jgi:hypothetical protein
VCVCVCVCVCVLLGHQVVTSMKQLAGGNHKTGVPPRTIIATVHQPSRTMFDMLDDVMLLGPSGRVAYCGPAAQAATHFAANGLPCPQDCNPPDHFLRILGSESTAGDEQARAAARAAADKLCHAWASSSGSPGIGGAVVAQQPTEGPRTLVHLAGQPPPSSSSAAASAAAADSASLLLTAEQYDTSAWKQFVTLLRREMLLRRRSKMLFKAFVGRTVIMTVLIGGICECCHAITPCVIQRSLRELWLRLSQRLLALLARRCTGDGIGPY